MLSGRKIGHGWSRVVTQNQSEAVRRSPFKLFTALNPLEDSWNPLWQSVTVL